MATIGTFTKDDAGNYNGAIKTLTLDVKKATFRQVEKEGDKAPDFRIFSGQTEFGAAWKKTSRENREYLSVRFSKGRSRLDGAAKLRRTHRVDAKTVQRTSLETWRRRRRRRACDHR
jgi:uncharacterized protein (DUF736 family)